MYKRFQNDHALQVVKVAKDMPLAINPYDFNAMVDAAREKEEKVRNALRRASSFRKAALTYDLIASQRMAR